jgi:hypothetical protein
LRQKQLPPQTLGNVSSPKNNCQDTHPPFPAESNGRSSVETKSQFAPDKSTAL